jgi:phospholipase C
MPADIQHVVVLMLENRSFDCMLGRLYPDDPDYNGLTLNESNSYANTPIGVWSGDGMPPSIACTPKPDPGESFVDMNEQLFGPGGVRTQDPPPMSGFAANYAAQPPSKDGPFAPRNAVHFFTPQQVPVISTLAKAFGVSDQWHASAPCQTWPNRFFAHTGTARGHVDNHTFQVPFPAESIFHRLQKAGKSWRVYFHDMPHSMLLGDIWLYALFHFRGFSQFLADAHTGNLPNYSFIEPRYFSDLFLNRTPNDEHPPHNVIYGEQLIAQVYNAVRSSPCWKNTLFVITYDEHGGCYDHVPPPAATSPDKVINNPYNYTFDSYGVRVPAVIVSPYIPPGSKIRPQPNEDGNTYPFDHTSIIATVRKLFTPNDPQLTARDGVAPNLLSALTLAVPTNDGPPSIDPSLIQPLPAEVQDRADATPNGMQNSLSAAAATLPDTAPATVDAIPAPTPLPPVQYPTVAIAHANTTASTNRFLGLA